jgi:SAM-dependent methyltransferase
MFPLEFDMNIYRNENRHLQFMNDTELINHYNTYGSNEGLVSCQIKNRYDFINIVPQHLMILEIGPLAFPSMNVNNSNVHTVDYFSTEELRENYKNDPNVNIDKICKVNYVLKDSIKYKDVIPPIFDICFSSHNIEHVPCLITFLNNISSILKNNSYFFLCIPDYRYCFDHFRNPSNIFEVLNSFYNNQNKPSPVSHLESKYLTCHNDSMKHWDFFYDSIRNIFNNINEKHDFLNNKKQKIISEIESIKSQYDICKNVYIDSHCWKFTPFIFRHIIEILYETKYIDFSIERVYKTLKGSNEFYVILKKN